MPDLTPRQARFVEEYLVDLNATQAAIRAGYAAGPNAEVQGSRLLGNAKVQAAVQAAQRERSERTRITQDRVLQELARIGFSDVMEHYVMSDYGRLSLAEGAPDGASAAVSSIKRKVRSFTNKEGETDTTHEVEFKVWDKNTALTLLGKHLGMFTDRPQVNVNVDLDKLSEAQLEHLARGGSLADLPG